MLNKPRYYVANWKMMLDWPQTQTLTQRLIAMLAEKPLPATTHVVLAPSMPFIGAVHPLMTTSALCLAAQNISHQDNGPYTGESSASQVASFCRYVILGHSERRAYYGESDDIVQQKAKQALKMGVTPIVCIGEHLAARTDHQTLDVLSQQIAWIQEDALAEKIIVAYEPLWAIGTGHVATPNQVAEVHDFLRDRLGCATPLLYGGSVKADNASSLIALENVSGFLVGSAACDHEHFLKIIHAES